MASLSVFDRRMGGRRGLVGGSLLLWPVRWTSVSVPIALRLGARGAVAAFAALANVSGCRFAHPRNGLARQPLNSADRLAIARRNDGDRRA